jgi:hypothetical protein
MLIIGAVGAANAALARSDNFCLQDREWGFAGNCEFRTYHQCEATASGTDAFCNLNPELYYRNEYRR